MLLGLGLVIYSHFLGTKGLYIREYAITNEKIPKSFDGFKIVHFSDLHYGSTIRNKEMEKIVNEINRLKPDLVVFTGDLIDEPYQMTDDDIQNLIKYLNNINSSIGKYIINGNHDVKDSFQKVVQNIDFKDLNNKNELVYYKGNVPINLVGLDDYLNHTMDINEAFNYENDYYTILLAHEPDVFDRISYDIDLMLSGHSHNGQVRLPFIGVLGTPEGSKKYFDEKYKINKTEMYISGGLGTSMAPFRFLVKPSINFYRLYAK